MLSSIRRIAITAAVICFFLMAVIGSVKGLTPATCCYRAIAGALISYAVISLAGRAVLAIIINAAVSSKLNTNTERRN